MSVEVAWHPPELNPDLPLGAYKTEDGQLAVWVDTAPDDPLDGSGVFQLYEGDEADYRPQVKAATPDDEVPA